MSVVVLDLPHINNLDSGNVVPKSQIELLNKRVSELLAGISKRVASMPDF